MHDMEAMIAELEASLADAPPEMRSILEQQIVSCKQAMRMLEKAMPAIEMQQQSRAPLRDDIHAFFTPEAPAQVGEWLPDDVQFADVTEEMLHCPQGARVYALDDAYECAIPAGIGAIPVRHGLSISFYHHGRLRSQRFYDQGRLRWAIEWHPSGKRDSIGMYSDDEPRQHREHGLITRFAPNGTIISQSHHWHGTRHGWSKLWEDDGYPISATLYREGQMCEEVLPNGEHRRY
jgi:hypothetical protein